ncbi:GTP 3',8-cyclase MoaA [uncultured Megasphaera sp.]|uniref:GTP 3',8-cyclase MoaA n=1 Tax=uncultured Megasphaera sp. TaxID=165188 RepID=UPI00265CFA2A|nr:GTP 3',8-cyclase MoaA [uncultured Megasphaera sp.]
MIDTLGRRIDYLRISITDRCNMRCRYCMPDGISAVGHGDVLRYEEIIAICRAALRVGITKFKVTGGEPFVRKGAVGFIRELRNLPGVESVTVTTNGWLLPQVLPELRRIGIDGVNISLDSLDREQYQAIAGVDALPEVLQAVRQCAASGLPTKINAVLLADTKEQIAPLARLAEELPVDVRFIELMPIGCGAYQQGYSGDEALAVLRGVYPDLAPLSVRRGNGPAAYYASRSLKGYIGMIAANSHVFCRQCNRLRLTSTGFLKPCLCYDDGVDLRAAVRSGQGENLLAQAIEQAILRKPARHCFDEAKAVTERKAMNEIGG